jgi:hypothetical protein
MQCTPDCSLRAASMDARTMINIGLIATVKTTCHTAKLDYCITTLKAVHKYYPPPPKKRSDSNYMNKNKKRTKKYVFLRVDRAHFIWLKKYQGITLVQLHHWINV